MAENVTKLPTHGVLFRYCDTGVLLTGTSGIGKSDLVLQLVQWGAQLVCDDAPIFSLQISDGNKQLTGWCEKTFSGILHIRDLGLIDISSIVNHNAVIPDVSLQLIIHLSKQPDKQHYLNPLLSPEYEQLFYKQVILHRLNLPYNAERPMALLVITAIKQYYLKQQGSDRCEKIIEKKIQPKDTI